MFLDKLPLASTKTTVEPTPVVPMANPEKVMVPPTPRVPVPPTVKVYAGAVVPKPTEPLSRIVNLSIPLAS